MEINNHKLNNQRLNNQPIYERQADLTPGGECAPCAPARPEIDAEITVAIKPELRQLATINGVSTDG